MVDDQQDRVQYSCPTCGYQNVWTRAQILQRGKKELYHNVAPDEDVYSLPCKNPASPRCPARYKVAIKREER